MESYVVVISTKNAFLKKCKYKDYVGAEGTNLGIKKQLGFVPYKTEKGAWQGAKAWKKRNDQFSKMNNTGWISKVCGIIPLTEEISKEAEKEFERKLLERDF